MFVPCIPEYIHEEILKQYGVDVPLSDIYAYLDSDPYHTPESVYDMYIRNSQCDELPLEKLIPTPRGFTVVDLAETPTFQIPLLPGNYIWVVKDKCRFPQPSGMNIPVFNRIKIKGKEYRVIYTGKASNLYKRLNNNHLNGRIATSTLRKTLAALFGFPFESYMSGHTPKVRIAPNQEAYISNWLRENCILLFKEDTDYHNLEQELIIELDPPLNIDDNPNINNGEYAAQLSALRRNAKNLQQATKGRLLKHSSFPNADLLHDLLIIIGVIVAILLIVIVFS